MKPIFLAGFLATLFISNAHSVLAIGTNLVPNVPTVVTRDTNRRVWHTLSVSTNRAGQVAYRTNSITELATGIHVWKNGTWVEADDVIEIQPNGTAAAAQTAHQVIFSANINAPIGVRIRTADENVLKTHILGIAYYDFKRRQSVLVAELKDCVGAVVGRNRVVYADAFDGVKADVRYTNTKQGIEQDIILRERPPLPESFGLDPRSTWIEVWTEMIDAPVPVIQQGVRKGWLRSKVDKTISFGEMTIGGGVAFDEGADDSEGTSVQKHWTTTPGGRTFLIEEVPFRLCRQNFRKLPQRQQAALKIKRDSLIGKISDERLLPARVADNSRPKETMKVAMVEKTDPGWVLDYSLVHSATNFTFQSDQTYLVSGTVNLSGTTTIEGGTVVKYTNGTSLTVLGDINCLTEAYRPAIFTSYRDNNVGESMYTGTNAPFRNGVALRTINVGGNLHDLHFRYFMSGFLIFSGSPDLSVRNCQFSHCYSGVTVNSSTVTMDNILAYDVTFAIQGALFKANIQHLTLDHAYGIGHDWSYDPETCFGPPSSRLFITNSLITEVTNSGWADVHLDSTVVTNGAGVYEAVAGGNYYLPTNSPYINYGTTNLSAEMIKDLTRKTTSSPVYAAPTNVVLSARAPRDTDQPDLGYHYDPLDYILTNRTISSSNTLWLTNGVGIGMCPDMSGVGGLLMNSGNLISCGTATEPNHIAWYNTVQEDVATNVGEIPMISFDVSDSCFIDARFTHFSRMGGEMALIASADAASANMGSYSFKDCRFSGNSFSVGTVASPSPIFIGFTNCLFERTALQFTVHPSSVGISLDAYNNLFYGGAFDLAPGGSNLFSAILRDNFFYTNSITQNAYASLTHDHNAYAYITNFSRLSPNGTGDVIVTNFSFLSDVFGNYYQPSNSPLINAGSWNATNVGLYHFTTQTDQIKETNSTVDIGLHYVALTNGVPMDSDRDTIPDYLEDGNGDGILDGTETGWQPSPPEVAILTPTNNTAYLNSPCTVTIITTNYDDIAVTNVEFFSNAASLGQSAMITNGLCTFVWTNVTAGTYILTARATDNVGFSTESSPVTIVVNAMPTVSLSSPATNGLYVMPTNILVSLSGADSDGVITNLQLFEGTNLLTSVTNSQCTFPWYNIPPGNYSFSAIATDNRGGSTTSSVMAVSIKLPMSNMLKIWLKADKGVSTNALGFVTNWLDQAGSGNLSQTNTNLAPSFAASPLNSRPAIRFNNNGLNYLLSATNPIGASEARSVIVAAKASSTLGGDVVCFLGSPKQFFSDWTWFNNSQFIVYSDTVTGSSTATISNTTPDPRSVITNGFIGVLTSAGGGVGNHPVAWLNGTNRNATQPTGGQIETVDGSSNRFSIGTTANSWRGDLGEVIVYNTNLAAFDRTSIEGYLNQKYSLFASGTTPILTVVGGDHLAVVQWNNNGDSQSYIRLERKGGLDTVFNVVAALPQGTTNYFDSDVLPSTTYTYRVLFIRSSGYSYSNEGSATTSGDPGAVPVSSLKVWLRADGGVITNSSGKIINWVDASGNRNDAGTTANTGVGLTIKSNALNGHSVVDFNHNFSLTLPENSLAGWTAIEAFAVVRSKVEVPVTYNNGLWRLGLNGTSFPASGGEISEDFKGAVGNIGSPWRSVTNFCIYNPSGNSGEWQLKIDGITRFRGKPGVSINPTPVIGFGPSGSAFNGEIAEIMVFDRTLTGAERDAVNVFLNERYGLVTTAPDAPTNCIANAISPNQISVSWVYPLSTNKTSFQLERKVGAGGAFVQVTNLEQSLSFIDGGLTPGAEYYYRVKAINVMGQSVYSNTNNATTLTSGSNLPVEDLRVWLKADAGHTGGRVLYWLDQSTNAVDVSTAFGSPPTQAPFATDNGVNGRPAVYFYGTNSLYLNTRYTNFLDGLEGVLVIRARTNTPTVNRNLWNIGLNGRSSYPAADGTLVDGFASTTTNSLPITPTTSLTNFCVYDVASFATEWTARLNGTVQLSRTNAVYLQPAVSLGGNFDGEIAEILFFTRALNAEEAYAMERYLYGKYGIIAGTNAPSVPTGLKTTGLAYNQLKLSWDTPPAMAESVDIERKEKGGTYSLLARVRTTTTNIDLTSRPDTTYYYRIKASSYAAQSGYSAEVTPPLAIVTNPIPNIAVSSGDSMSVSATAVDDDATSISKVELFNYTNLLSTVVSSNNPYNFTVTNLAVGSYSLSVRATDSHTNSRFSFPVKVIVSPDSDGDGTNDVREIMIKTDPTVTNSVPAGDTNAPQIYLEEPRNATPYP